MADRHVFFSPGGAICLRWSDAIVAGGLLALIAFAALALGAVHREAYTTVEIGAFALIIVWMAQVWREGATPARISIARGDLKALATPAIAFAALIALQAAPLPPAMLKIVSPATWRLYAISFPGWPAKSPYEALRPAWNVTPQTKQPVIRVILPPVGGTPADRAAAAAPENAAAAKPVPLDRLGAEPLGGSGGWRWRSLSIAPAVTLASLIELLACGAIFFLVLLYPAGYPGSEREANSRFIARMVVGVLAIATAIALLGVIERAAWNGKILWLFVPRDWDGPQLNNVRASGPFVNPDHFADFLVMALPLAVVGAIFPLFSRRRGQRRDLRMECAIAAFAIGAGVVLSLSRAGWAAAAIGVTAAVWIGLRRVPDRAPLLLRRNRQRALPLAIAALGAGLALMLFLIGPAARNDASARFDLAAGVTGEFAFKRMAWRDTIGLIRNFPLFGVGMGCWPELFPHFRQPPWIEFFYREPENDYIQLLAETGVIGMALALWFAAAVALRVRSALPDIGNRHWPLLAGLGGGIAAVMVHEIFDFSLHTPANAVLFTVTLAILARVALTHRGENAPGRPRSVAAPSQITWIGSGAIALGAAAMIFAAIRQARANYPYDIGRPRTLAAAERVVTAHPANAGAHLALAALMPAGAPQALREAQLRAAVWLDPNDPLARDLYARSLLLSGRKPRALDQITISVAHSPAVDTHFYLSQRMIPWLLPDEQHAISSGYRKAIADGYGGAVPALAQFYGALGRYAEAGRLALQAARTAPDQDQRQRDLIEAGRNFAGAKDYSKAAAELRKAIAIDPSATPPYRAMLEAVMTPERNVAGARALVRGAIAAGADPVELDYALADVAQQAGDTATAEQAMNDAELNDPTFDPTMRLGDLYMSEGKFDRATLAYQRAARLNPQSAIAFFKLAQAEQSAYDYGSADRDYARAVALDPDNAGMRQAYRDFQKHTAAAAREAPASRPDDATSGGADETAVP